MREPDWKKAERMREQCARKHNDGLVNKRLREQARERRALGATSKVLLSIFGFFALFALGMFLATVPLTQ